MEPDFYALLGVPRNASSADLRVAYKRLAASERPPESSARQRGGKSESIADAKRRRWLQIQTAYDTLMNPRRRGLYDRNCPGASEPSPLLEPKEDPPTAAGSLLDLPPALSAEEDSSWGRVRQVFEELLSEEPADDAPRKVVDFGGPLTAWEEVRRFYDFWSTWGTRRPFESAGAFSAEEMAAAPNRAARRCMEQENEKRRRGQRLKFNAEVREAVAALRDRDPRVQARARACAEEAQNREAFREAEEERRQAERRERRRAARESELQRWAETEAEAAALSTSASAPPTPSFPPSPWVCNICDGKAFPSHQAYEDHRASKRHKRNARGSPEISPPVASPAMMSPYMLPSTAAPVNMDNLPGLQLPVAASSSTGQEAEAQDEWGAGYLSTLRKEHWCGIFAFLTSRETILPIGALLCARALRSGAFADAGLW
ncbi:dnajc21, partial [Symbiodinium necroappetens]